MYKKLMEQHKQHIYYKDDNMSVTIEDFSHKLYVHIVVNKFSMSTYKKLKSVCTDIYNEAWLDGYDAVYSYTTNKKFLKLFPGYEYIDNVYYGGQNWEVYKWDLK